VSGLLILITKNKLCLKNCNIKKEQFEIYKMKYNGKHSNR